MYYDVALDTLPMMWKFSLLAGVPDIASHHWSMTLAWDIVDTLVETEQ